MSEAVDTWQQVRAMTWATISVGDTAIAQICPACSGLVAPGTGSDRPHKEQHVQWHERTPIAPT